MLLRHVWDQEGFTIQEILVALVVGSLLIAFSMSTFSFVGKLFTSWKEQSEVRNAVAGALQQLALDIVRSRQVLEITESTLVVSKDPQTQIVYRFDGKHVWRDNVRLAYSDGVDLAVAISSASDSTKALRENDLLRLRGTGRSKHFNFFAETQVAVRRSGRQEFLISEKGLP